MIQVESALHKNLVVELMRWLKTSKAYTIKAADLEGYEQPSVVKNSAGIGDGEDKRPDIDAYDNVEDVRIRGEAKVGDGDLETLHTETQLRLFSNLYSGVNKKMSLLYIIVPAAKFEDLMAVLRKFGLLEKPNVIPVRSGKF